MTEVKKKDPLKVVTPMFRASYAYLFEARAVEDDNGTTSDKKFFSVQMLFPKGCDLSALKAAADAAVIAKWGEDKAKWPKGLKWPFRDQDADKDGHEDGGIFVRAKSGEKNPPGVVGLDAKTPLEPSQFWSGCYARAELRAYTWEHKTGGKGVSFGLQHVQFLKDGPSLGGRSAPSEAFEPVVADLGGEGGEAPSSASALFG